LLRTRLRFWYFGQAKDVNASAIGGVTIALSGSASGTTTSDSSGNYSFANLAAGGNYLVTPLIDIVPFHKFAIPTTFKLLNVWFVD